MLNALQVARKEAQSAQSSVDRSNLIQIVATLCGFGLLVFQGVNKALADSKERGKARAAEHAAMTVAKEQNAQLGQIHALVNSKMTEQMESELRALLANRLLLWEAAEQRKISGSAPAPDALGIIELTDARIAELERLLVGRAKATDQAASNLIAEEAKPDPV